MKRITWEEWITNTEKYCVLNAGILMYPIEIKTGLMISYMVPSSVSCRNPIFMKWWLEECTEEDANKLRLMQVLGDDIVYDIR